MEKKNKNSMTLLITTFYINCHVSVVNQFNLYKMLMRQDGMFLSCHNNYTK